MYVYLYVYICMYVNVYCRVLSIGRGIQRCMYVHIVIISKVMILLVYISTMIVDSYYSGGCKLANSIGIMVFLVAFFTFFALFEPRASADKLGRYAALGGEGGAGQGQGQYGSLQ